MSAPAAPTGVPAAELDRRCYAFAIDRLLAGRRARGRPRRRGVRLGGPRPGRARGSVLVRRSAARELPAGTATTLLDGDVVRFGDRTLTVVEEG